MSAAAAAALVVTVAAFVLARRLDRRVRRPWTNPVGLAVAALIGVVASGAIDLDAYRAGTEPLVLALRPAVVALGWLVYRQRDELRRWAAPLLVGSAVGSAVSLIATPWIARAAGAGPELQAALALKSVTSAVGVDLATRLGVDAALTVPFVILTGILGAAIGPTLLRRVLGSGPAAIGVAVGCASHGIGTAAVAEREGTLATALSGLAMALTAVLSGAMAPLALRLAGLA